MTEERLEALGFSKWQQELYWVMSRLSERNWFSSWVNDCEFSLWEMLQGKVLEHNGFRIHEADLKELEILSRHADGWIYCGDLHREPWSAKFVSFTEWEGICSQRDRTRETQSPLAKPRSSRRSLLLRTPPKGEK